MVELGSYSEEAHKHIGSVIAKLNPGIDFLFTVGDYARFIGKESGNKNWKHFTDSESVSKHLAGMLENEDIVLLQGSNNINLETVIDDLEKTFGVRGK